MTRHIRKITAYLLLATFAPAMLLSEGLHLLPGFDHYHCNCSGIPAGFVAGENCGHQHRNNVDRNTVNNDNVNNNNAAGHNADGNCLVCEFVSLCQSNTPPDAPALESFTADRFIPLPESFNILRQILTAKSRAPPVTLA